MAAPKEAIALLLDVGPSMDQAPSGEKSALETALELIIMIVQRKIFAESKDEVALILCGAEDTDNPLATRDSYRNIAILRPLGVSDFDLLQMVQSEIRASRSSGDVLDGLVVAMDHLVRATEGKKGFASKRVVLLSDMGAPFSDDQLPAIIAAMRKSGTELTAIGPQAREDEEMERNSQGARPSQCRGKEMTPQQRAGQALVHHILQEVDGECYSFSEALPAISFFQSRQVKPVAWKCQLQIGSGLSIPICAYPRIKEFKLRQSWKKVYARDIDAAVGNLRTFHRNDEEETEVEKEDIVEGYRYGKDIIPMTADDKENMKYHAEKCLTVLGFTKEENIKRHHYLGDGTLSIVAEREDEAAGVALSALINALYETDCVAIARRVYSAASAPRIGVLMPHIKTNYECLVWVELPFAEDLRQFTFGSLPLTEETFAINKKYAPSNDQLQAMEKLITDLDLSQAQEDEDGEKTEVLKPRLTFNPFFQRLYQCLQHRALNPDDPLPTLSPLIAASLNPPSQIAQACMKNVNRLKRLFKLEVVTKKKEEQTGESIFKSTEDQVDQSAAKRIRQQTDLDGGFSDITKGKVTEVGSVAPTDDFLALISSKNGDQFATACQQMGKRVEQIVLDSFGDQFYNKAVDCLKVLRRECINRSEPHFFNNYIKSLKNFVVSKSKRDFWDRVVLEKQGLISRGECPAASVSQQEVEEFIAEEKVKLEDKEKKYEETTDDLLEMI